MQQGNRKVIRLAAGFVLLTGIFGSASAFGALVKASSTKILRTDTRSNTTVASTGLTSYVDFPNAAVKIAVPAGMTRLIKARFTAESHCNGLTGSGTYCSVRIVAFNTATSSITELHPAAGAGFAFDSMTEGADDKAEAHAMERSGRLKAGAYEIKAQWAVMTPTAGSFNIDHWHFSVETWQ